MHYMFTPSPYQGRLNRAFLEERVNAYLKHTAESISSIPAGEGFHDAADAVFGCSGKVITTGMGKAGHAARKVASSFSSLGIPSVYVHPGEASHGDIGMVSKEDILLAFSTSGKTREVLETIEFSRHLGISRVISVTSHPDADVRKVSDIVVDMGMVVEAGHLSIAPSTSIVVMLTIADMIASVVAEARGFKMENYAARHHGGYLGKKSRGETDNV